VRALVAAFLWLARLWGVGGPLSVRLRSGPVGAGTAGVSNGIAPAKKVAKATKAKATKAEPEPAAKPARYEFRPANPPCPKCGGRMRVSSSRLHETPPVRWRKCKGKKCGATLKQEAVEV